MPEALKGLPNPEEELDANKDGVITVEDIIAVLETTKSDAKGALDADRLRALAGEKERLKTESKRIDGEIRDAKKSFNTEKLNTLMQERKELIKDYLENEEVKKRAKQRAAELAKDAKEKDAPKNTATNREEPKKASSKASKRKVGGGFGSKGFLVDTVWEGMLNRIFIWKDDIQEWFGDQSYKIFGKKWTPRDKKK